MNKMTVKKSTNCASHRGASRFGTFTVCRNGRRVTNHFVSAPKRHYFCDETIYFPETKRLHLVTDLFSTASIKTSRTSSEPTATTSLRVDQPSDACDQPQSQMCDPQSEITSTSATEVEDSSTQKTQKKGANRNYQDSWKAIYPFIDYDPVKKNVLQNLCRFQNSKKLICDCLCQHDL